MSTFYQLGPVGSDLIIRLKWQQFISDTDPEYLDWLDQGGIPLPAEPLPAAEPKWDLLYSSTIDPDGLLPVFQRIKAIAKVSLPVNASYTTLIPTLTTTRLEAALAIAIHELAADLEDAGEVLTQAEKNTWNQALTDCGFSPDSPARL